MISTISYHLLFLHLEKHKRHIVGMSPCLCYGPKACRKAKK